MNPVDRLHALDAVRAYALLLGIVLHTAAAFVEGFPMPGWVDTPSVTAGVMYYLIHMFRMSAFFLIAGFFARMVVERRGIKPFVRDRLKRIAVPLFLGWPFIFGFMIAGALLGALVHGTDYLAALFEQPQEAAGAESNGGGGGGVNTAHLWFLYYLLIFYAVVLVVRAIVHAADQKRSVAALADRIVAFIMRGVWGPVVIALPIAAYLIQFDTWNEWIGLPAPFSLVPRFDALVGYGVAFGFGWLLHRQVYLLLDLRRTWWLYLTLAIVLTVASLRIVGVTPHWGPGPTLEGSQRVVYAIVYMTGAWCWIFAFVGAAVRFLSSELPINRYLADASYWMYLMHMGTVVFFINAMRPFDWHWSIKLTITLAGSVVILLVTYRYFVRYTWIGAILNGKRHARPPREPTADSAPAAG